MAIEDPQISTNLSTTFREFVLLPRLTRQEHALDKVSLETFLSDKLHLAIPFLSAAMGAVSGSELAIALALEGGLSILPAGKVEAAQQVAEVKKVKEYRLGFTDDAPTVQPSMLLSELQQLKTATGRSSFPVVDRDNKLLGLIANFDYHPLVDLELAVSERMTRREDLKVGTLELTIDKAADILFQEKQDALCIVDNDNRLRAVVFSADLNKLRLYPNPSRDHSGRLRVGAAISTHPEDVTRARLCVEAGADVLCIDASDGFSEFMATTIEQVKKLGVPVIAGNVVDAAGFEYLAEAGADAIKIGIGSGSICTTRRVKSIGRGQAVALRSVALARDEWARKTKKYLPLISDGGIEGTGDMAIALAMGADLLMMGKYFAGFTESPPDCFTKRFSVPISGRQAEISIEVKPYWGEASPRAKNVRRYQQNDPRTFVIEGVEGYILHKGSLSDSLAKDLKAIRSTLSSCGCSSLAQFRQEVMLERQSLGSQSEGGTSIFLS